MLLDILILTDSHFLLCLHRSLPNIFELQTFNNGCFLRSSTTNLKFSIASTQWLQNTSQTFKRRYAKMFTTSSATNHCHLKILQVHHQQTSVFEKSIHYAFANLIPSMGMVHLTTFTIKESTKCRYTIPMDGMGLTKKSSCTMWSNKPLRFPSWLTAVFSSVNILRFQILAMESAKTPHSWNTNHGWYQQVI